MAKPKLQFLCNNCGSVHPKWMGKCPDCGTWDSLEEYKAPTADPRKPTPLGRDRATSDITQGATPLPITEIDSDDMPRTPTGVAVHNVAISLLQAQEPSSVYRVFDL